jgi:hypothetical protein
MNILQTSGQPAFTTLGLFSPDAMTVQKHPHGIRDELPVLNAFNLIGRPFERMGSLHPVLNDLPLLFSRDSDGRLGCFANRYLNLPRILW